MLLPPHGRAAACGEEKFDLSERIARFGDILNRERPIVEIGPRSLFDKSAVGGRQQPAGDGLRTTSPRWSGVEREAWGMGRQAWGGGGKTVAREE